MERGNRIVIRTTPDSRGDLAWNYSTTMGGVQQISDQVTRMELSLEECEAIVVQLPSIIEFIVRERQAKLLGPDGLPVGGPQ